MPCANKLLNRIYNDAWIRQALLRDEFRGVRGIQYATYNTYLELRKLAAIIREIERFASARQCSLSELSVADLGCSDGRISIPLGSLGLIVVGVEGSKAQVEEAGRRNPFTNVRFILANLLDMAMYEEFQDSFDVIVASDILEHLSGPEIHLHRWRGLLRAGGRLLLALPNGFGSSELVMVQPARLVRWATRRPAAPGYDHLQHFTYRRLRQLLHDSGFGNVIPLEGLGTLSSFPFLNRSRLAALDCRISNRFPMWLRDRWLLAADAI